MVARRVMLLLLLAAAAQLILAVPKAPVEAESEEYDRPEGTEDDEDEHEHHEEEHLVPDDDEEHEPPSLHHGPGDSHPDDPHAKDLHDEDPDPPASQPDTGPVDREESVGEWLKEHSSKLAIVHCDTTKGPIKLAVNHDWSPIGAGRFMELVDDGFFTDQPLYRAVDNFLTQFGISGDPDTQYRWAAKGALKDDSGIPEAVPQEFHHRKIAFKYGMVSFAGGGEDTRDTSMFFATSFDQGQLDWWGKEPWETPFAQVTEGIDVLGKFYTGYGDMAETGNDHGPSQQTLAQKGNAYIKENFPKIDFITSCSRVPGELSVRDAEGVYLNISTDFRKELAVPQHLIDAEHKERQREDAELQAAGYEASVEGEGEHVPEVKVVHLRNNSTKVVKVYWDDGKKGIYQGDIVPGSTMTQHTYAGHTFVFREGTHDDEKEVWRAAIQEDGQHYDYTGHVDL